MFLNLIFFNSRIYKCNLYLLMLLAPQNGAHLITPHRDPIQPIQPIPNPLIALEQENPEKTHDVIYF